MSFGRPNHRSVSSPCCHYLLHFLQIPMTSSYFFFVPESHHMVDIIFVFFSFFGGPSPNHPQILQLPPPATIWATWGAHFKAPEDPRFPQWSDPGDVHRNLHWDIDTSEERWPVPLAIQGIVYLEDGTKNWEGNSLMVNHLTHHFVGICSCLIHLNPKQSTLRYPKIPLVLKFQDDMVRLSAANFRPYSDWPNSDDSWFRMWEVKFSPWVLRSDVNFVVDMDKHGQYMTISTVPSQIDISYSKTLGAKREFSSASRIHQPNLDLCEWCQVGIPQWWTDPPLAFTQGHDMDPTWTNKYGVLVFRCHS